MSEMVLAQDPGESLKKLEVIPTQVEDLTSCSVPVELDGVISEIASSGVVKYQWSLVKNLIKLKLNMLFLKYFEGKGFVGPVTETFDSRRSEVLSLLDKYEEPPFTIQRLAEIITNSSAQYQSTHKLLNGVEKLLMVTSTIADAK